MGAWLEMEIFLSSKDHPQNHNCASSTNINPFSPPHPAFKEDYPLLAIINMLPVIQCTPMVLQVSDIIDHLVSQVRAVPLEPCCLKLNSKILK